jgi:hypothetical protein
VNPLYRPLFGAALWPCLLALAGCATDSVKPSEPVVVTKTVEVPVTAACVPDNVPDAPTYSDSPAALKAAKDGPERLNLALKGRQEKTDRLSVIEPVLAGCRKAGKQ